MSWRGTNTPQDRIIACLTYLVPILEVWIFGSVLVMQFPVLLPFYVPLLPVLTLYTFAIGNIQIVNMAIFFGLFLGIVRNEASFRHFVRFHTMQALMIAIAVYLFSAVLQLLGLVQFPFGFGVSLASGASVPVVLAILLDAIFLGVVGVCIYSIVQGARGLYAEIPYVSDAVYMQVR